MFSYPSEQYTVFVVIVHHIEKPYTRWIVSSSTQQQLPSAGRVCQQLAKDNE